MGIWEGMGKGPLGSEMPRSQRYNIPGGLIRVYIIYTDRKSFEQSRAIMPLRFFVLGLLDVRP